MASFAQARATDAILRSPETKAALEYRFTAADQALLDEVQCACFAYFWKEVGTPAKLVKDRQKAPVSSIAAVGFQLSSLPIGVQRGWITRQEGLERARTVLKSLIERKDNKKFGVYLHYPDVGTAGLSREGFEILASTVDHALFVAGAIPAAEYFGGDIKSLVDRLIAQTNWKAYAGAPGGFLSMGWKPDDPDTIDGTGRFLDWRWWNASDEERLIYLLAVGSPNPDYAVEPEVYYRLKRPIKRYRDMPPYVVSWPGALFTYFFSHCWIDYGSLGPDDPSRLGVEAPRVDWFENSRRAVMTHRRRCIEQARRFKTLAPDRWGLSACAARDGYIVPRVGPNLSEKDEWFEGTLAPYAAASAIMFAPAESLAAIRAYRSLNGADGKPLVWRDPKGGGYGFVDSFNLDQDFVCDDYVGIDQGPMLLAIENARTGLIWKLFMQHDTVQRALKRLRLRP
ncbi:MAG: glucoamylase family protein [Phycisphaerae bacterium]